MCTMGFNFFCCGCKTPIEGTLSQCEYAKLRGSHAVCPDFQIVVDERRSRWFDLLACMAHSIEC
ncbi:hypothetical protein B0T19DRAFT_446757 [Cercophora scortea]|uniref:Uncharacterized protein n=1 Tax=Cercophora scortea TaxID=314031 RepID=A0AAE0M3G6_9PEZI|nr:hypothetical protein B0T19DRAFT_446757 [Cercophora scortea]